VSALQEQFVTEARELISQATDDLIALERDGTSPERIDRVFRAFHTLKGSAGVVELPAMSIMLHAAEDLLASVRQGTLDSGPDIIDATLASLDQMSRWVDDFEATGALPAQAGEDGRMLAERIRSFLPAAAGQRQPASAVRQSTAGTGEALPEWAAGLIAEERDTMLSRLPQRASAMCPICWRFTSSSARVLRRWRISIPTRAICVSRPSPPATLTKLPGSFGWCRIRCRYQAFRRMRLPRQHRLLTTPIKASSGRSSRPNANCCGFPTEPKILRVAPAPRRVSQPMLWATQIAGNWRLRYSAPAP
jgi:HPt (histidine-containing phosphotransfer) domain-containing protein